MEDENIIHRITTLVDEEKSIRDRAGDDAPADHRARLAEIEQTLDQCWDLLRQRRALREYKNDPTAAQVRDAGTVEGYQQ